jgi:hypothetical protein
MRGSGHRLEEDATEKVGVELLLSFGLLESLLPIARGELENAVLGPARDETEQVAHVRLKHRWQCRAKASADLRSIFFMGPLVTRVSVVFFATPDECYQKLVPSSALRARTCTPASPYL